MTRLTVFAEIESKDGKDGIIKDELIKLLEETKRKEGCVLSDLKQDDKNPNVFKFYEQWSSRELWQDNKNSECLQEYINKTNDSTKSFIMNEMTILI